MVFPKGRDSVVSVCVSFELIAMDYFFSKGVLLLGEIFTCDSYKVRSYPSTVWSFSFKIAISC